MCIKYGMNSVEDRRGNGAQHSMNHTIIARIGYAPFEGGGPQRSGDEPGLKICALCSINHNSTRHGRTRMNHLIRIALILASSAAGAWGQESSTPATTDNGNDEEQSKAKVQPPGPRLEDSSDDLWTRRYLTGGRGLRAVLNF